MQTIQSVKGIHDVLPDKEPLLDQIEQAARQVLQSFAYEKIRLPVLEKTELFKRSIGDITDIVEKEMYSFTDAGGEQLSLRPEGTAGCVRACLQHNLIGKGQIQRLWYQGAFFRRERPQKGRYRQFHQIGTEAFGCAGAEIDAEMLLLSNLLWERLGIGTTLTLKLNTLGSADDRKRYRTVLSDYLNAHRSQIDDQARQRIESNPLRVLDSKDPSTRQVTANAPRMREFLSTASIAHYKRLQNILQHAGITFEEDEYLVRGLDYYTGTVFEWINPHTDAQNAVCAGGRYDGLVGQLGGAVTPAIGLAIGIERVILAMDTDTVATNSADVYIAAIGERAVDFSTGFAVDLRRQFPSLRIATHCAGGSIKAQLRRADKSGAQAVLIFGDEEINKGMTTFKPLRQDGNQEQLSIEQATARIKALASS